MPTIKVDVGSVIGKLTVLEQDVSQKKKSWKCRCDCGNIVTVTDSKLKYQTKNPRMCDKCEKKKAQERVKMTQDQIQEWNDLYEYVRQNVMGYAKNQVLPSNAAIRLQGLASGRFYANKKIKEKGQYSYRIVLMTFKYSNMDIQKAFKNKSFKDENHKFNYACAIVESNLNTVYNKMESQKRHDEDLLSRDFSYLDLDHKGAEYKRRTEEPPPGCEDLW